MRAVILAAGRGGRLRGVVGDRPKCLARVGDCTLVERQIRALRDCGVDRIAVAAGYRSDEVRRACGPGVDLVLNARYASTNSLYSLWLARDLFAGGLLVLNSDVLFHPDLLRLLLASPHQDALLFSPRTEAQAYSDEEMKVSVRDGLVIAIDKGLPDDQTDGENIGIARFGSAGAAHLVEALNRLVAAGATNEWLPRAFASFCQKRPLHALESGGLPWIEIDFPEDYWRACGEVLPAIERTVGPAEPVRVARAAAAGSGRTLRHV